MYLRAFLISKLKISQGKNIILTNSEIGSQQWQQMQHASEDQHLKIILKCSSGFQILAFPCNQFFGQESGSPEEIKAFVADNFKAKFPIMQKVEVNGENTHPLFVYLRNNSSLYDPTTQTAKVIPWNFAKFFINSQGKVINFFAPNVKADEVGSYIETYMKK